MYTRKLGLYLYHFVLPFITPGYVTVQFSGVAENLPLWTVDGNNCEKSDAEI